MSEYVVPDGLSGSAIWSTTGTTPWINAQDQPTNIIYTATNDLVSQWYTFGATSGTGSGFSVNCSIYWNAAVDSYIANVEIDWTDDGTADWSTSTSTQTWAWDDLGTVTGLDTATEINAARIRFTYNKGAGGPDQLSIDAARLGVSQPAADNYMLDFEYSWTAADYDETNENVSIYVQTATQGGETLQVWEWTGSAWSSLGAIDDDGWNNFSLTYLTSAAFYILINDTDQSLDATQNSWNIDLITLHVWTDQTYNYEIDFEYQWTHTVFNEENETLCIYVTGGESENLTVWEWTGTTWSSLGEINSTNNIWHNYTISYLTSGTYTIRLLGDVEASDTTQNTWELDAIFLFVNSTNIGEASPSRLDIEEQWTAADFNEDTELLCIKWGSISDEQLDVYVWYSSAWNYISSVTTGDANSWTNFSVSSYLTAATFTIRFGDNITDVDSTQSTWQKDSCLLRTYNTTGPSNDQAPTLENPDDTDNMYARYKNYQISVNVSHPSGFANIDTVNLSLWDNTQTTEYWAVSFDEDTETFTEHDPNGYITLSTSASLNWSSGNDLDIMFVLNITWTHPDISDVDAEQYVNDSATGTDDDFYEVNWDVETRLDLSVGPTLNDGSGTADRGNIDGSITASGTVIYYGGTANPLAVEIDLWISASEYGTQTGPWNATNLANGGTFSHTVYADDVVGQDTYTFKAVVQDAGAGGTDLMQATQQDTYIADQIVVQTTTADDTRVDIS
ncbi:MAG: hypothetical protein ACXADO_12120, partial [Candidatus Thorarchaeota archaeon]